LSVFYSPFDPKWAQRMTLINFGWRDIVIMQSIEGSYIHFMSTIFKYTH